MNYLVNFLWLGRRYELQVAAPSEAAALAKAVALTVTRPEVGLVVAENRQRGTFRVKPVTTKPKSSAPASVPPAMVPDQVDQPDWPARRW